MLTNPKFQGLRRALERSEQTYCFFLNNSVKTPTSMSTCVHDGSRVFQAHLLPEKHDAQHHQHQQGGGQNPDEDEQEELIWNEIKLQQHTKYFSLTVVCAVWQLTFTHVSLHTQSSSGKSSDSLTFSAPWRPQQRGPPQISVKQLVWRVNLWLLSSTGAQFAQEPQHRQRKCTAAAAGGLRPELPFTQEPARFTD